ncbi:type VI secretion system Vgr family protein [Sorangium sp. So ce1128]
MGQGQLEGQGRGRQADYVLGTPEGWGAFRVIRWHGIEEISQPFRYDITLLRAAEDGPIDLDRLLDAGATFRIATQDRWRSIHGILAEVEELERTSTAFLYRVLLVPHIWRARHRTRCRNFVNRTLRDILFTVLENRSPRYPEGHGGLKYLEGSVAPSDQEPSFGEFVPPNAFYHWMVADPSRVDDVRVSPYVVQYNESDFDFLSRLLEMEGLSYYFEHVQRGLVLLITDMPGQHALFPKDREYALRGLGEGGQAGNQEVVHALRDARRLKSRAVTLRDHDYHRNRSLEGSVWAADNETSDEFWHFEFPAGDELLYKDVGMHRARVRLERYDVERQLREGTSTVRTMEPGRTFKLRDQAGLHPAQELLAVRIETWATELTLPGTILDTEKFGFSGSIAPQRAGFESRFWALSAGTPFRPAMSTPRPRIQGVQTAVVTAEEHEGAGGEGRPVINADPLARVRVRFPWDQRADGYDRTPSSDWIRVSQQWAGAGYGALYTPRVGHEVLVAYLQGDPDRPVIVGRVYNGQNKPPYDPQVDPTRSTLKSQSASANKEVDGFNEIRFEDRAKKEEIYLHAQRDFNEVVRASHSTTVGGKQSNSVAQDQSNTVKGDRTHDVTGTESVHVQGDRTTLFDANERHEVGGHLEAKIGANEARDIGGFRRTGVGANDDLTVAGWHNVKVGGGETCTVDGKRDVFVGGNQIHRVGANAESTANGHHAFTSMNAYFHLSGDFQANSSSAGFHQRSSYSVDAPEITLNAGGCKITMSAGLLVLDNGAGAVVALAGGVVAVSSGSVVTMASGTVMTGAGGEMSLTAGATMNATATAIKLNG